VCLAVHDTGLGIAPEDQPYLFDRSYRVRNVSQTGYIGTGLRLAIMDQIVKLHNGAVEVQSELGKGSQFVIHLPAYKERICQM